MFCNIYFNIMKNDVPFAAFQYTLCACFRCLSFIMWLGWISSFSPFVKFGSRIFKLIKKMYLCIHIL
jgi:hypothetical protein